MSRVKININFKTQFLWGNNLILRPSRRQPLSGCIQGTKIYIATSEGSNFWVSVLNIGGNDILIACVDGLKCFPDAIATIFPKTTVQLCIVHLIRKGTKNKVVFTNDTVLGKLVDLAYTRIRRKWTQPLHDWRQTAQELAILFVDMFILL